MSFLIRRALRYAVQKVAADPRAREKAAEAARFISAEAKTIAREENRAYAAGRSVRRALDLLKGGPASAPEMKDITPPRDESSDGDAPRRLK